MKIMNIRIALIVLILAVAASAASKIKVACVGNSITAGSSMYPPYLQTLLGSGYQVENEGVGGTTLLKKGDMPYWTRGRLKQALAFNPNIVTIKLGTNDTKSQNWDAHGSEFKKDYLSMVDTFKSLAAKPDIFLVLPVPVYKANNYGIRDSILKKIIVIIKEIGAERNLPIIDANTPLLGFGKFFSDGVHPNGAGSDSIAHIIYRALTAKTAIASENGGTSIPTPRKTTYRPALRLSLRGVRNEYYDLQGKLLNTGRRKMSGVLIKRALDVNGKSRSLKIIGAGIFGNPTIQRE